MAKRNMLSVAKRRREAAKRAKRKAKQERRARRAQERAQAPEAANTKDIVHESDEQSQHVRTE